MGAFDGVGEPKGRLVQKSLEKMRKNELLKLVE